MILSNFPTKTITPESIGAIPNPTSGTAGQVLTKTADGSAWENAPSGLPEGGTEGQMLYKSADGAVWGDKPVMWVRITYGPGNTTADKTFTEIKAAYDSGAYVCAYIGGGWDYPGVLQLKTIGTSYAHFSTAGGGTYAGVEDDDVWTVGFTNLIDEDQLNTAINEVQENVENVLPSGGTTGQVLTKTSTGEEWSDAPSGLPEGGTEGQVLKRGASGAEWDDAKWLPLSGGIMDNAVRIRWSSSEGPFICSGVITPELRLGSRSINNVNTNLYIGRSPGAGSNVAYLNYSNRELRLHLGGEEDTVGRLTGLKTPVASNEATPKSYVDTQLSTKLTQEVADTRYLQLGGGTINGTLKFNNGMGEENYASIYSDKSAMFIDIPGGEVYIGSAGRSDDIVVTRGYIDDVLSGYLPLSGGTLTGDIHIKSNASDEESDYAWIYNEKGTLTLESASGYVDLHVKTPIYDDQPANKAYVDSHPVYHAGTSAPSSTNLLWIDTNATTGGLKYYNGSSWVHVPVAYS